MPELFRLILESWGLIEEPLAIHCHLLVTLSKKVYFFQESILSLLKETYENLA
jgi:hypothetical protein